MSCFASSADTFCMVAVFAFTCRQGLGRYAGFELGQRGQLQELFDELGNPGAKRSAGE
jgi:hypothetical protein